MFRRLPLALFCAVFAHTAGAAGETPRDPSRGELLYDTHCITCHNTEVHWRDKRLSTDWASLQTEVRRWQENASLGWSDADVTEVARYLNARYYSFPTPK